MLTTNESSDEQQAPQAINTHKAATVAQPLICYQANNDSTESQKSHKQPVRQKLSKKKLLVRLAFDAKSLPH